METVIVSDGRLCSEKECILLFLSTKQGIYLTGEYVNAREMVVNIIHKMFSMYIIPLKSYPISMMWDTG